MDAVVLQNVSKQFNSQKVLQNISFSIATGSITCIVGASGAGKTTLLRLIAGLEMVSSGTIVIDGKSLVVNGHYTKGTSYKETLAPIGFVFQNFGLFPHLSVINNLLLAPRLRQGMSDGLQQQALQLLEELGLSNQKETPVERLSGGEKQRLSIARALMLNPSILLFDEPTSALDPERIGELVSRLQELKELGKTIIIITHDYMFANQVADQTIKIENGQVIG